MECPRCKAPRVTKAAGRTRLTCASCGAHWLARDASEAALVADAAPETIPAPLSHPAAAGPPRTGTPAPVAAPAGLGAVSVLAAEELRIAGLAFPEPAPQVESGSESASDRAPEAPVTTVPAADVVAEPVSVPPAPRKGPGYYGRVLARG